MKLPTTLPPRVLPLMSSLGAVQAAQSQVKATQNVLTSAVLVLILSGPI